MVGIGVLTQRGDRNVEFPDQMPGAFVQLPSGRRQYDPSPGLLEQRHTHCLLECPDSATDRGLGNVEQIRGACDVTFARRGVEGDEQRGNRCGLGRHVPIHICMVIPSISHWTDEWGRGTLKIDNGESRRMMVNRKHSADGPQHDDHEYDAVLIGGGIMSATLGALLTRLEPDRSVLVLERLDEVAAESSAPWNNAGTGHAGLCELNYMPDPTDSTGPRRSDDSSGSHGSSGSPSTSRMRRHS